MGLMPSGRRHNRWIMDIVANGLIRGKFSICSTVKLPSIYDVRPKFNLVKDSGRNAPMPAIFDMSLCVPAGRIFAWVSGKLPESWLINIKSEA
jgi:hypothetical protein